MVILIDPSTFGGPKGAERLAFEVSTIGIPVRIVSCEADLEQALTEGYRVRPLQASVKSPQVNVDPGLASPLPPGEGQG